MLGKVDTTVLDRTELRHKNARCNALCVTLCKKWLDFRLLVAAIAAE